MVKPRRVKEKLTTTHVLSGESFLSRKDLYLMGMVLKAVNGRRC
jgi:hypothetical protein